MRNFIYFVFTFLFFLIVLILLNSSTDINYSDSFSNNPENTNSNISEKEPKGIASFEIEKKFFSEWNHPYGNTIPNEVQDRIWNEIKSLPEEDDLETMSVNSWKCLGPYGIAYADSISIMYSGRVKDIEPPDNVHDLRVGSASGGIWSFFWNAPYCISNTLETPWLGTFATDPDNKDIIFAGTGEPYVMGGRGLYRTTNGGASWQHLSFAGYNPWCFYKIRFDPNNSNKIHAASTDGYFRSDDNGANWTRKYPGLITDFSVNIFNNSNIIYIAEKNETGTGGILKSTNGGDNFVRITSLPTNKIHRSVIDCGNSPNIVYVMLGDGNDGSPLGVYRSDNSGSTWSNITPTNMFAFDVPNVEYMAVISVCPASTSVVMAGTKSLCRSTNGGQTWTEYIDIGGNPIRNIHGDHHRLVWRDGDKVYSANDGGIAYSSNRGATWITTLNYIPVTQFYLFDAGVSNKNIIYGGTQDNGIAKTSNLGNNWIFLFSGDGGGIDIDPMISSKVFATHNDGGNITYRRFKTLNGGLNWTDITSNLPPHDDWATRIISDKSPPVFLYTNAGAYIYKTTNDGTVWTQLNTTAFPTPHIFSFSVSTYIPGGSVIYACLKDEPESGNHAGKLLRVYDNGNWYERSTGLPQSGAWVRNVAIHPTNISTGYALLNGFSGQKVFKTTNRGTSWTNISGNLPNVPVSDLIPHPTDNNKLYLSSQNGCYKTTNAGTNWYRWNNGMPDKLPETIVNDLCAMDSISINGRYYILAATYGRGIWMREISGDDPIGIVNNSSPAKFSLSQNYPNPFNPATRINYSIAETGIVKISVYDVLGKTVQILVDEKRAPGNYSIDFKPENLSSGIYFYQLEINEFIDIKKMVFIK